MNQLSEEEIKQISLQILIEFDKYCRNHKLTYYLAFGTLLGSVRHKGFIPWDEDVDVCMPRPDFERFQKEYSDNDRFKLYSTERTKKYYYTHMKLCDINTYQILSTGKEDDRGIAVDIFAIDGQIDDSEAAECRFQSLRHKFVSYIMRANSWKYLQAGPFSNNIRIKLEEVFSKTGVLNKIAHNLDKQFSRNDYDSCNRVGLINAPFYKKYFSWDKKVFKNAIEAEFEGYPLFIPEDYDNVLKNIYGDYMTLPPIEKRVSTHQEQYYNR